MSPKSLEPSNLKLKLEEVGMEKLYFHQANHSKITYPRWMKSMTPVIDYLLDQQAQYKNPTWEDEVEEVIIEDEPTSEASMFLWDMSLGLEDKGEEEIVVEELHAT